MSPPSRAARSSGRRSGWQADEGRSRQGRPGAIVTPGEGELAQSRARLRARRRSHPPFDLRGTEERRQLAAFPVAQPLPATPVGVRLRSGVGGPAGRLVGEGPLASLASRRRWESARLMVTRRTQAPGAWNPCTRDQFLCSRLSASWARSSAKSRRPETAAASATIFGYSSTKRASKLGTGCGPIGVSVSLTFQPPGALTVCTRLRRPMCLPADQKELLADATN